MPPVDDLQAASLALSAGICLIALFLGLREGYELRARETCLTKADHIHFSRQDVRRRLGVGVLFAIALLVLFGSRLEPLAEGKANVLFLLLWIGVLALIALLFTLALLDWWSTRAYGRRRRREMLRESLEAIRSQAREARAARTGQDPKGLTERPGP
jgi:hypothetical protein